MRIAIVDDLETERTQLKTRLARQLRLCGAEAELLEFESGESFLAAEKEQRFTAAFLDIYMHGMSGMTLPRSCAKRTQTAFWFLPRPQPTTRWRAFRSVRSTIS